MNHDTILSRRRFLQWGAVGIGGAAIAACAAPAAPAAAPEEGEMAAEEVITISWWHAWGGTTGYGGHGRRSRGLQPRRTATSKSNACTSPR